MLPLSGQGTASDVAAVYDRRFYGGSPARCGSRGTIKPAVIDRRYIGGSVNFPKHWTTDRLRVDSVQTSEGEALTALWNSSTDVVDLDPTFYVVDLPEVMGL